MCIRDSTSSLLLILCRFSKCSFHTPLTSISLVTKAPSLFIILSRFPLFSFLTFRASFQNSFLFPCKSPFILLPNCSFTSCFLLRMHLLVFLFSSLYNSKHLSFETSSFAFSTFNHASFLLLTAFITFSFLHLLLTFLLPTLAQPHTSFALLTIASFICSQICSVSTCSHSTDLLASVLTYLSLLACSLNFSLLILPTSFRITFLSIQVPTNLILH